MVVAVFELFYERDGLLVGRTELASHRGIINIYSKSISEGIVKRWEMSKIMRNLGENGRKEERQERAICQMHRMDYIFQQVLHNVPKLYTTFMITYLSILLLLLN